MGETPVARLWGRLTFAAQLMLGTALALSLAGALLLVTSTQREANVLSTQLEQQLQDELNSQLPALADFVVVGDYATIEQVLAARVRNPHIHRLTWHAAEGGVVDVIDREPPSSAPAWFSDWLAPHSPSASRSLSVGGREYGVLTVQTGLDAGIDRLWQSFLVNGEILALALGLEIVGILLILRHGLRPLRALNEGARRLGAGDLSARIEPQGGPEMRSTIQAFNGMAESLSVSLKELAENRENLATTLHSIGDGVVATDRAGCVTRMNSVAERLTGWPEAEARGRPLEEVFPIFNARTRKPVENPVARVLATGAVVGLANHTVLRSRDGHDYQIADSAAPIRGSDGAMLGVVLVFRDVTEEYALRESMRESEARFRAIFEQAAVGMAQVEVSTGRFVRVNRKFAGIVGYSQDELARMTFPSITHPDDQAGDWAATVQLHAGEVTEFTREKRYIRRDGSIVWVTISVSALDSAFTIVVIQDITDRRQADEDLRIAATAFESEEAMMVTSADEVILRVNRAFSDITGYESAEVVGKTPRVLASGRHDPEFYREMWRTLARDKYWQGEIWNRCKDGRVVPTWQAISAVTTPDGHVSHYVSAFSDISQRKEAEEQIRHLAYYDSLTRLPNRRLLIDRLTLALAAGSRRQRHGALLFIDLDHFKVLNDTEGHDVGDLLLVEVARRLRSSVREGDTVARLGGDEFVVMLEDLDEDEREAAAQAEAAAEKIRQVTSDPFLLHGREHHTTLSIGIGIFHDQRDSVEDLLKHADVAMYQAKSDGRNAVRFFDPRMQSALEQRATLEGELRRVVSQGELVLFYQPQIDSQHRVLGAEGLLRWRHPTRGLVPPSEFIPLAEETGLIVPIGQWVLETACTQLKVWEADPATRDLVLAVNVSVRQFRQPDFADQVREVLTKTGANPSRLKLELTESLVVDNVEDTVAKMAALRELGVGFAMDDFGIGYSSLSNLKLLPLDQLKIDRSFVQGVADEGGDAVIVRTIIAMAKSLGLNVIAEGVEEEAQRQFLDNNGCPTFQGYLYSQPVPIEVFERLLK